MSNSPKASEAFSAKAQDADALEKRIAQNSQAQEVDLEEWIFNQIEVGTPERVLEICCGTGSQTEPLLARLNEGGELAALDISEGALEKLSSRLEVPSAKTLHLVQADMDELGPSLEEKELSLHNLDLAFCAYGLYYSDDAQAVLGELKGRLNDTGHLVVVGPFGPNNSPLFDMLKECGVSIPHAAEYPSSEFMYSEIIPWGAVNFHSVTVNTVVNRITWEAPEHVLEYWQSSTFYDEEREEAVWARLEDHFDQHDSFINEKWIMMLEMKNAR